MSILEAIILGIIQGLTEFLPVSSSGHIELGKAILDVQVQDPLLFSIVVHGATALSTIIVFRKTIASLFSNLFSFKWNEEMQYLFKIAFSMIPVLIVGLLFKDQIEFFFEGNVMYVGILLCFTGVLLLLTSISKGGTNSITFKNAGVIGVAQAIAVLPGISRSGATIVTALLLKTDKQEAAKFSFLMVLPPIFGMMLLEMIKYFSEEDIGGQVAQSADLSPAVLIFGFIAAFISGIVACKWMIWLVKKSKLQYFGYYCLFIGGFTFIYLWLN